jgi:hypothetical protein
MLAVADPVVAYLKQSTPAQRSADVHDLDDLIRDMPTEEVERCLSALAVRGTPREAPRRR